MALLVHQGFGRAVPGGGHKPALEAEAARRFDARERVATAILRALKQEKMWAGWGDIEPTVFDVLDAYRTAEARYPRLRTERS